MASFFRSLTVRFVFPGPSSAPKNGDPPSYQMSETPSLPSSPPPPRPPPPPHPSRPRRFPWRDLVHVVLALVVSGLVLAIIVLFLLAYDGEQVPLWKQSISLNSVLSWLGALGKLALTVLIAECLGQMKWVLFGSERRKLSDMDLIDGASRDAIGALAWIFRFRGGFLVHLGAAFVIASLGFDPAIQQLVSYELRTVADPGQTSLVSANLNYVPVRGFNQGLILATPRSLLWGATSSVLGAGLTSDFTCPSGNCNFPAVTSVGVCQTCSETTAQLERNCTALTQSNEFCQGTDCFTTGQICTYSQNGTSVGGGTTFLNLTATPGISTPIGDKVSISAQRISLTALYIQPDASLAGTQSLPVAPGHIAPGGGHAARAFSCGLSFCEQQFQPQVVNGQYKETLLSSTAVSAYVLPIPQLSQINDALLNTPLAISSTNKTRVSTAALFALSNGFTLSLTGRADAVVGTPKPGDVSEFHRGMYENLLSEDFSAVMAAMTASMSAAIRNDGAPAQKVHGSVYVTRIFVRVNWHWLAFPAAMWAAALVLAVAVTVRTRKNRRGPVGWLGNSQVSALFLGLDDDVRRDVDATGVAYTGDTAAVRAFAEKLKLRIGPVAVRGEGTAMRFTKNHD